MSSQSDAQIGEAADFTDEYVCPRCGDVACETPNIDHSRHVLHRQPVRYVRADLVDALDGYVGHQRDCGMAHGAPECTCGFDDLYTRIRVAVRGEHG